jgi:hypothetical protein
MDILSHFGGRGVSPKYRDQRAATHHGFPIKNPGMMPNMRDEEYRNIPVEVDVQVRIFDLLEPTDMEAYQDIRDRIANRACIQLVRREIISTDGTIVKVLMEWAEPKGRIPTRPGTSEVGR